MDEAWRHVCKVCFDLATLTYSCRSTIVLRSSWPFTWNQPLPILMPTTETAALYV